MRSRDDGRLPDDAGLRDTRPIQRIGVRSDADIDDAVWPATVPAIAGFLQVARTSGWELRPGVTFLVGENGSGKSTLLEAIASAYGLPAGGGTLNGGTDPDPDRSPLADWLRLVRSPRAPRWGFFLRAETMHGYYTYLDDLPDAPPSLHPMSHGESFNALLDDKLDHPRYRTGLACLDEPEAALSFGSMLRWLAALDRMRERGTQVLCATHSPVLAALPGAHILELGEWGIRESTWDDVELVRQHRSFLQSPARFFRHLLD